MPIQLPNESLYKKSVYLKILFHQGYVDLGIFSYHRFIHKNWHEVFVKKNLVKRNAYGQFVPILDNIAEFGEWMSLYKRFMNVRDFPQSYSLTPGEADKIKSNKLFDVPPPLTAQKKEQLITQFSTEQTTFLSGNGNTT